MMGHRSSVESVFGATRGRQGLDLGHCQDNEYLSFFGHNSITIAYTVISCYTKTTLRTNEFPFAIPYNHAPGQHCNFTELNTPIPFKSLIWEISCVDCLEQVMGEEKKRTQCRREGRVYF